MKSKVRAGFFTRLRAAPDRDLSIANYRAIAGGYDASSRWIVGQRAMAVEALALAPGETVYDVACGTGATLGALAARVGPAGRVFGIEHSPEMAAQARARAELPANVTVLDAPVETVSPGAKADAMLFCYTHDVLQSPVALDNLLAHAKPGARLAVVGMRFVPWWWGAPINLIKMWRGRHYVTTYRGFREPWALLAARVPDLRVVRWLRLGTNYLAVGRVASGPELAPECPV